MEPLNQLLNSITTRSPGAYSALLCSNDGRSIAHVGEQPMVEAMAAITASAAQLGRRLADVLGDAQLDELTVRSGDGYVILYTVGERCVLTVMTAPDANLALTHLVVRDLVPHLIDALQERRPVASSLPVPVVAAAGT